MTKSTPVPIDGRDVILRDKYRAIVAEYSSEIVEILQAVKYDTEADTARLVKCVRDLDNARQQLLNIEVKLSYEESKSKETRGETDIDFDAIFGRCNAGNFGSRRAACGGADTRQPVGCDP